MLLFLLWFDCGARLGCLLCWFSLLFCDDNGHTLDVFYTCGWLIVLLEFVFVYV